MHLHICALRKIHIVLLKDTVECESRYGSYARGANCYETPFWGAYHKHFQVMPVIKADSGLKFGEDKGVHDYDYFLEVRANNKAHLTTVLSKKVKRSQKYNHT
jgi:hypothetical protein